MWESWLTDNALMIAGFIGTGVSALWRINVLEKRMDKNVSEAREDRRRMYEQMGEQALEIAGLKGQLRGAGLIDGE